MACTHTATMAAVRSKAARDKAAVDHAVDQMLGNVPGSETWEVDGSDAPLSGAVPVMAGVANASVARIPIPGTNGTLAIELTHPTYKGSTSTVFIQDVTGKKHLRLDYGYNTKSKQVDYHWNRKGAAKDFWGIQDHDRWNDRTRRL